MDKAKGRLFINNMQEGCSIAAPFLLVSKNLMRYKNKNGTFANLVLADRSGHIQAMLWDCPEEDYHALAEGGVVSIEGDVTLYNGRLQLTVSAIAPCESYRVEELLPVSKKDLQLMQRELAALVQTLENEDLKKLLEHIMATPELYERFCRAPAAQMHHQAYIGGLLEHTLGVAKTARAIATNYPGVDMDLLMAGALLHDIGKIEEMTYALKLGYSDEGRLLGHIVLGTQLVSTLIQELPDFPEDLKIKVLHMIVSHHGEYEWQSPKRPKFLEAMLLHYADMIDAQVDKFIQAKEGAEEDQTWSPWIKGLDRYLYLK